MKTMRRTIFSLSLCLLFTISFQQDQISCDPNNRPSFDDCINQEFTPTCGYYKENCPFEICGLSVGSGCFACQDPRILYYKAEECKPEETVSECSEDMCSYDPEQAQIFEPVCGFSNDSQHRGQSRTFDNVCKACETGNYHWYQNGVCEDDKNYCNDEQRSAECSGTGNNPVCASLELQEDWSVFTTASDSCNACKDSSVDYYTTGQCGPQRDNTTYCLPNNRPDFCTKEYNPVCGFSMGDEGAYEHKIISNPCMACADSDVIYHIPGPCEFTCNRNPNIIFECIGSLVDPICGTYEEDGEKKQVSLKNACIGCYNVPIQITSYVDGLCPGDVGIRCENDASGFLQGIISPVCGIFEEGCNDSSCRQTFSEPFLACNEASTILYMPGICPGDEGISCEPFRLAVEENGEDSSSMSGILYQNVCGYSEAGCEADSCRQTYNDQFEACGNESVIFFAQGPCGGETNEEGEVNEESL